MPILAQENNENSNVCKRIYISSEDEFDESKYTGWNFYYTSESDFEIIIPSNSEQSVQPKIINNSEINILFTRERISKSGIISIIDGICNVIEKVTGQDICGYIVRQSLNLLKTTGKALPNGKYRVTYTYVPGRIPGCQPIHSGVRNSGYWKASYTKIG